MAIGEATLGLGDPVVAIRLNTLARVLRDLDELDAARALVEQAVSISQVALGPDHPDVAKHRNTLALVLRDLGDPPTAAPGQSIGKP